MKLLLTSGGVTNQPIANELQRLVGKPVSKTQVAVIPTAAFVEAGEKSWFVGQFTNLQKYGFSQIDLIEPSLPHTEWRERLGLADVVFVSGGNTYYLLDQARRNGFAAWLQQELGERVYVGASAGSILVTPTIAAAASGDTNVISLKDLSGVGLVGFEVLPHVGDFTPLQMAEQYAAATPHAVYALDDQSAVSVDGKETRVISEGHWHAWNQ